MPAVVLACLAVTTSCTFTGIENTGHISLSKDDIKAENALSEEDKLMQHVADEELETWRIGKPFLAASERVRLMFLSTDSDPYGSIIRYTGYETSQTPVGNDAVDIKFRDAAGRTYIYQRELPSGRRLTSADMPMLIDLEMVACADSLLRGHTLWPRTRLWESAPADGDSARKPEKIVGQQFVPVKVEAVVAGTPDFPCRAIFTSTDGKRGSIVFSPSRSSSRSFASQFTLTDPHLLHRDITDEKWNDICNGRLSQGMTKKEARLAYGTPDDIASGHDYSKVIENWYYSNGAFLHFEDGLLINFRR